MNAWVSRNRLPLQHQAPEITKYRPGAALDCAIIATALAFQPSFELDDAATSNYQQQLAKLGPRLGYAMFFGDVFRSAPFDKASSVPDATGAAPFIGGRNETAMAAAARSADRSSTTTRT